MKKVFSFCNQKGGVGKTTTAVNLASCLSDMGKKVLLIDLDPQGNATSGIGLDKKSAEKTIYNTLVNDMNIAEVVVVQQDTNVSVAPANKDLIGASVELVDVIGREFLLKKKIDAIKNEFDYILIDCPPSLGITTLNALVASDALIIPLQCEYYALEGLAELVETYQVVKERLNPNLEIGGVVMTMADFRTNLTQQVIEEVKNHFQNKIFETIIPRSVKISEAPSFGKPINHYDASSKGSQCYIALAKEFAQRYEEKSVAGDQVNSDSQTNETVAAQEAPNATEEISNNG